MNIKIKSFKTRLFAIILDSNGNVQNQVKINKSVENFKIGKRRYSFKGYEKATMIHHKGFYFNNYYLFYHNDEFKPLTLAYDIKTKDNNKVYPDTEFINSILEADTLKKLNDLSKPNPFANLDPKLLVIGAIAIAVAIYFLQGGSLT